MTALETGTEDLRADIDNGVAVITMNRPDRRNAFSPAMGPLRSSSSISMTPVQRMMQPRGSRKSERSEDAVSGQPGYPGL